MRSNFVYGGTAPVVAFVCLFFGIACSEGPTSSSDPGAFGGESGGASSGGSSGSTAVSGASGGSASPGGSVSVGGTAGTSTGASSTGGSDPAGGSGGGGTVVITCDDGAGGNTYEAPLGTGTPGEWTKITMPVSFTYAMSVVADPVRINEFYGFLTDGAGTEIHVVKSTDYGATWAVVNSTTFQGDPWGAAIDPSPCRDPETPPTIYTPAGYGSSGVYKSVDGGVTWTQLFTGANVFSPYTPFGTIPDVYSVAVLPDDPPNHLLLTFHGYWVDPANGQKNEMIDAGLGESTNGGATWMLHEPPNNFGQSHYLMIVDSSTWLAISQDSAGEGIWKTSTAGRDGGNIATSAWKVVDSLTHVHGCFNAVVLPNAIYAPGSSGIHRSTDAGETWTSVFEGTMTHMAATPNYLYADNLPSAHMVRSAIDDGANWTDYCTEPGDIDNGQIGPGTQTFVSASDGTHAYLVNFNNSGGVWRYVE